MPYLFGIKTPLLNIRELQELPREIERLPIPVEPARPDTLHITILYIGRKIPQKDTLSKISRELSKIGKITFRITNTIEILPNISKPRTLAIKIEDRYRKLRNIRNILLNILKENNITIEDKFLHDFNPHITLGRIRAKISYNEILEILNSLNLKMPEIIIETDYIELIDSTGGSYNTICRISTHY